MYNTLHCSEYIIMNNYSLFVVSYSLFSIDYLLFIVSYSLFDIHYSMFVKQKNEGVSTFVLIICYISLLFSFWKLQQMQLMQVR